MYMIGMGSIHVVLRGSTWVSLSTALLLCTGKGDVQQPWPEKGTLTQGSDQVPSLRKSPRLAEAIAEGEGHLWWLMEEGTKRVPVAVMAAKVHHATSLLLSFSSGSIAHDNCTRAAPSTLRGEGAHMDERWYFIKLF